MTAEELREKLKLIADEVNTAADIATVFAPQFAGYVRIGKAVSLLLPDLAADIAAWVEGGEPTQAEEDETLRKINVLLDPNLP